MRNDWQNRVYIRNIKNLQSFWLLVPVIKPNGQKSRINEVCILEPLKTFGMLKRQITSSYVSSKFWDEIISYIDPVFDEACEQQFLSDFLYCSLKRLIDLLCPQTQIVRSSEFMQPLSSEKNLHLIELCNSVNGTEYICGSGGLNYIDKSVFLSHGINVVVQDWNETTLREKYADIPWRNISFIDFWARYGLEELKIVLGGNL